MHSAYDASADPCAVGAPNARVRAGTPATQDPNTLGESTVAALERRTAERAAALGIGARALAAAPASLQILVHWHVILRDNGTGNVTNARIQRQLDVLNAGFAGTTSSRAAATPFRFATASIDRTRNSDWYSWSNPSVDRSDDTQAKTALGVNPRTELNVYIAALEDDLLGYATFPGNGPPGLQGVVLLNGSLPGGNAAPYNLGDSGTHEVGHWLGLFHTFQGGCQPPGDRVTDTPAQLDGDNIFFCRASDDTCTAPGTDPVHNFMSYGDDACLERFSKGQSDRMVTQYEVWRS